jgi:adenylosuccinate lyase
MFQEKNSESSERDFFYNKTPIDTVTATVNMEILTEEIAKNFPHIITEETKLVLLLTKKTITYQELVDKVSKCSHILPYEATKLVYKLDISNSNIDNIIDKIREAVLLENMFWVQYKNDAIKIWRVKKFKEQLTQRLIQPIR